MLAKRENSSRAISHFTEFLRTLSPFRTTTESSGVEEFIACHYAHLNNLVRQGSGMCVGTQPECSWNLISDFFCLLTIDSLCVFRRKFRSKASRKRTSVGTTRTHTQANENYLSGEMGRETYTANVTLVNLFNSTSESKTNKSCRLTVPTVFGMGNSFTPLLNDHHL